MIPLNIIYDGFDILVGFFQQVLDSIAQAVLMLEHFFEDLKFLTTIIDSVYDSLQGLILGMPIWLSPFATLTLSILALYLIMGRSHS